MGQAPTVNVDFTATGAAELSRVMHQPVTCSPTEPIRSVLATMHARAIGSMVIVDEKDAPLGIFTLRDVLDRVSLDPAVLDEPIANVMSKGLRVLPPHATVYEGVLAMLRHGIRHVLVVDAGRLVGLVSEKDLFALQPVSMRHLASAIRGAPSVDRLVELSIEMRAHARELLQEGTAPAALTALIASLNDLLTQRILDLELCADSDRPMCWIALGSEGRREQTLHTDQDNGLIFVDPGDAEAMRARLLPQAQRVNEALARCGFPLCQGGIMASNPRWCLSLPEWEARFADWIDRGDPQALLASAIFFDFRCVYGERSLTDALRETLLGGIARSPRFLHQMAANALANRPPINLLGQFSTHDAGDERHTIDLKMSGAMLFTDAARIYGLAVGSPHSNTCDRLRDFAVRRGVPPLELQAWIDGFLFIQVLRLRHQHAQAEAGRPLSNRVDPAELNVLEQRVLKEAFRQAAQLQLRLKLDYQL